MPENYGAEDYGEDVFGGELTPVIGTDFIEYFPQILPREQDSVFRGYVDSHGIEFDGLDGGLAYTKLSHSVRDADGKDLQRIGALFGQLGAKGSRSDSEYRQYLQSLISSFNARGTIPGVKFAVAAAANTDTDNVVITEDFDNNEYSIEIQETDSQFISGVVIELAELADPSGVELAGTPLVFTNGATVGVQTTSSTVIDSVSGLGSGVINFDGNGALDGA